ERDVTYKELLSGLHRHSHHLHLLQRVHLVLQVLQEHQDLLSFLYLLLLHLLTTFNTRYKSAGLSRTQELSPIGSLIPDDSIPNKEATALVSAYETPAENSLLAKTGDMKNILNWYCRQVNKTMLTPADLEGQAYEVVKAFYPDVIHLQFQVKGSSPALSISKMKATSYPDFDILLRHIKNNSDQPCRFSVSSELKPTLDTGYEFKHDYTIIESPRAVIFPISNNKRKIMRFNEIYKFSNGTLMRILEALAYIVKEFKIKQINPGFSQDLKVKVSNLISGFLRSSDFGYRSYVIAFCSSFLSRLDFYVIFHLRDLPFAHLAKVMEALVISISLDVSVKSVGSSFQLVSLIGSISIEVPVAPVVWAAVVASPARVLKIDTIHRQRLIHRRVHQLLYEMPERHVSPTSHDAMLTRIKRLHDDVKVTTAQVIVNGDSVSPVALASAGAEGPMPPKTVEQKLTRKNELKAKKHSYASHSRCAPTEVSCLQGCKVLIGSNQE
nr:hypothetical protein [Tanacetum cinerariifolium]